MLLMLVCVLDPIVAANAHDFWIETATYRPEPDAVVRLALRLGGRFVGPAVPYDPDRVEKFVVIGPDGERPVVGRSGTTTAFARVASPATYIVSYRSTRSQIELPADTFTTYLRNDGLFDVIKERQQRGEQDSPGREVYSRCAKALLTVGDGMRLSDREVGLPLEIVLDTSGNSSTSASSLCARVTYQGQPLPGLLVFAVAKDHPDQVLTATSDADGWVEFALSNPGVWMLTTIHMIRAADGLDADWESLWASTTFETPPRTAGPR